MSAETAPKAESLEDDILKELGLDSDNDKPKEQDGASKKRDRDTAKGSDEDLAPKTKKAKRTHHSKSMDGFIVSEEDSEGEKAKKPKKKRDPPPAEKPDFDMPEIDRVLKAIFGDSEDEKLAHFSSDEEHFSDLSDIDEGVVPRAKKQVKQWVTYSKRMIAASKRTGGRRRKGSDDEVDERDILPEGTKRRKRPVMDDDELDASNALPQSRKSNGKKMSDEDIRIKCVEFVEKMEQACFEDNENNRAKKPALKKLSLLEEAKQTLLREEWHEELIKANVLVVLTKWLQPLPDRTLPSVTIRDGILRALTSFGEIDKYHLRESKIGSIVMFLSKNDPESSSRDTARSLLQQWSRALNPDKTDSWTALSEVERQRRAAGQQERLSESAQRTLSSQLAFGRRIQGSSAPTQKVRGPQFASQPILSTMDYVIRPESKWEQVPVKKSGSVKIFASSSK